MDGPCPSLSPPQSAAHGPRANDRDAIPSQRLPACAANPELRITEASSSSRERSPIASNASAQACSSRRGGIEGRVTTAHPPSACRFAMTRSVVTALRMQAKPSLQLQICPTCCRGRRRFIAATVESAACSLPPTQLPQQSVAAAGAVTLTGSRLAWLLSLRVGPLLSGSVPSSASATSRGCSSDEVAAPSSQFGHGLRAASGPPYATVSTLAQGSAEARHANKLAVHNRGELRLRALPVPSAPGRGAKPPQTPASGRLGARSGTSCAKGGAMRRDAQRRRSGSLWRRPAGGLLAPDSSPGTRL